MIKVTKFKKRKNPANWYSEERILNGKKVLGITADNHLINHLGLKVLIKPFNFLKLVDTDLNELKDKNLDFILKWMKEDKPVAHPFIKIMIPDDWFNNKYAKNGFIKSKESPYVLTHEGRHRMASSVILYENIPVEVYLFFVGEGKQYIRTNNIDNNFRSNLLNNGIYSEFDERLINNAIEKLL